jgi:hypothetical protein
MILIWPLEATKPVFRMVMAITCIRQLLFQQGREPTSVASFAGKIASGYAGSWQSDALSY